MPYWGDTVDGNDYAFDAVGVYVILIRDRMFEDAARVCEKAYPEQSIGASVRCIRGIYEAFPKSVSVVFGKREIARCRELFEKWCEVALDRVPQQRRDAVRKATIHELELLENALSKRHSNEVVHAP